MGDLEICNTGIRWSLRDNFLRIFSEILFSEIFGENFSEFFRDFPAILAGNFREFSAFAARFFEPKNDHFSRLWEKSGFWSF